MTTQAFTRGYDDYSCDCVLATKPDSVDSATWREYNRGVDAAQNDEAIKDYDG